MKKACFLVLFSFLSIPIFAVGNVEAYGEELKTVIFGGLYFLAFLVLTILSSVNLSITSRTLRIICIILLSAMICIFLRFLLYEIKDAAYEGEFPFMDVVGTGFSVIMIALNIFFITRSYKNMKKKKALDNYFHPRT